MAEDDRHTTQAPPPRGDGPRDAAKAPWVARRRPRAVREELEVLVSRALRLLERTGTDLAGVAERAGVSTDRLRALAAGRLISGLDFERVVSYLAANRPRPTGSRRPRALPLE